MTMPGLFDPITIGNLKLKNRIVMPPMANRMAGDDGAVLDRHIAHYAARAGAGVGLIVVEHAYIDRGGRAGETQLGIHDDRLIPGLRRLADAIRAGGAASAIQITHAGGRTTAAVAGGQPIAPSAVADPLSGETPRTLTVPEIAALTSAFATAAWRAAEAGFDIIEIHGAHGYLLGQFLSPLTNRRTDRYGGDLNGRLTFAREVTDAVKGAVGKGFPLFYRLGADDLTPGGLHPEDGGQTARHLALAGIDVIDVSGGYGGTGRDRFTEQGFFVPLAETVRKAAGIPVIGVGNIHEAEYADRVIREGRIDMAAVGRALLADPLWALKAARKLGVTAA
jgi:2,4-dienoyl-CoA reductase-like NADH-dependent reductase (Old Yellow Enzyme family)